MPLPTHLGPERVTFGCGGRQRSVDHQLHHVVELALLGELDGRVLPVVVEPLAAAHVAHVGVGDDHTLQTARYVGRTQLRHPHQVTERDHADEFAVLQHGHVPIATFTHRVQGAGDIARCVHDVGR